MPPVFFFIVSIAHSGVSEIKSGTVPWNEIFPGTKCFHFTGIRPAISQSAADVSLETVKSAREKGLTVSCDLNHRAKLWKYGKTAGEVMAGLMPYVDVAIGNEEDCEKIFGIKGADVKVAGEVSAETYLVVARELMKRFSNLKKIAITLRGSISATHNTWSAVLYDGKRLYSTMKYDITNVIDRLGSGDAFTDSTMTLFDWSSR
jgi:2-dehydro-3-deoxygluconokinase